MKRYRLSGSNLMTLNWGCTPATRRAEFSADPRIVYFGSLNVRFIALPLLSRLSKIYPHIDVHGGPPPDASLELNYLGARRPSSSSTVPDNAFRTAPRRPWTGPGWVSYLAGSRRESSSSDSTGIRSSAGRE